MKTFTLRLTDDEAEALERIAYIENELQAGGMSKNQFIVNLIADKYSEYETHAVINGKIRFLTRPALAFAIMLYDNSEIFDDLDDRLKALAAVQYAAHELCQANKDDPTNEEYEQDIEMLNEMKNHLLEEIRSFQKD